MRRNFLIFTVFVIFLCTPFVWCTGAFAETEETEPATETELTAADNVLSDPDDQRIVKQLSILYGMGWNDSDQEHRKQLFEKMNKLKEALKQKRQEDLAKNTKALEENYQNMKDKETSFENRMLGGLAMGTVGIGGMMAASALSEQNADKSAEQDMQAYLATFKCKVGDNRYSGGTKAIETPGANQLINLYQEYAELAADLKERKTVLGLKAGVESEIKIDKASSGLYDNVGNGIGSGAYASIARALQDPNGEDAKRWAEQKEAASSKLKTGAITAGVGIAASIAANYAINHGNDDKSAELLAQREEIKQEFIDVFQFEMDECNAKIKEKKERAAEIKETPEYKTDKSLQEYVANIEKIEFLTDKSDVYKLKSHSICN